MYKTWHKGLPYKDRGRHTSREGFERIIEYGRERYDDLEVAYNLVTASHETAGWLWPIREGAISAGPTYTDEQSIRAVTDLFNRGRISWNYALPHKNGQSYYGRGLVQLTLLDNYKRFGDILDVDLVDNPDAVLDWDNALFIMFHGIHNGSFTGRSFNEFINRNTMEVSKRDMNRARSIVNADRNREFGDTTIGNKIAENTLYTYEFLRGRIEGKEGLFEKIRSQFR